jgi:cystathionine beta-lyase family protein involved in aluminum resistance
VCDERKRPLHAGTHAIAAGLFACLRPGDDLLCASGDPYDTLEEVIGIRGQPGVGSLVDFGVTYRSHNGLFKKSGGIDASSVAGSLRVGALKAHTTSSTTGGVPCQHAATALLDSMEHMSACFFSGRTQVCHIQRSCGYSLRPTLTVEEIGEIIRVVRAVDKNIIVSVDNCYGTNSPPTTADGLHLYQACNLS